MRMLDWWRRFTGMADAERAKILAFVAAGMIVALLYGLGGLSLYLRAHYLRPSPPSPGLTQTVMPEITSAPETQTPTLFPTLTSRPAEARVVKAVVTIATSSEQGRPMARSCSGAVGQKATRLGSQ
ncbi:MAG: hypothetical protein E3J25_07225 [Anaerolineales bacterium]|nr:MAG: hypothetical protein E3J25_07225 [Anaerolineales bacterium]